MLRPPSSSALRPQSLPGSLTKLFTHLLSKPTPDPCHACSWPLARYRALGFFAVDGSGLRLLRASAASSMAEALASLQTSAQSQEMLRCLADWLRLLVSRRGRRRG